jgi:phage-related protein
MPIELLELLPGDRFTIYAIDLSGACAVREFLEQAERQNLDEADSMHALLNWTAQSGPPRNKEKCREVGDGIYEFKAKSLRICWFYDSGRMIICSHGFYKGTPKVQNREFSQARKTRDAYLAAKKAGPIPTKKT